MVPSLNHPLSAWTRAAVVLAILLLTVHPAAADGQRPVDERGEVREDRDQEVCGRVGQIFIIGNTVTLDSVILKQLPLFSGEEFTFSDLRSAERNLARLNLFKADPAPLVRIMDRENDSTYKDIRVDVAERPVNIFFSAIGESVEFAAVSVVRGLPAAILRACGENTFPGELIDFIFTGGRSGCPLVIRRLLDT
ncbi:MAG TPA: POTRA domain-containing protein [Gemmataceae bacterium]|jgi:hypothetical protein